MRIHILSIVYLLFKLNGKTQYVVISLAENGKVLYDNKRFFEAILKTALIK